MRERHLPAGLLGLKTMWGYVEHSFIVSMGNRPLFIIHDSLCVFGEGFSGAVDERYLGH